nr:MAG TPA: repressor protein [Caudoviricetes sp.]
MGKLYNTISNLCKERGITGYKLCKDIGIQPSIVSDLKSGRKKTLNVETARKIAEYFDVSIECFLDGQPNTKAPTLNEKDERDIAKNLDRIMSQLEQGGDLMFDGNPMSDEARESIRAAMKLGLEAAKVKNKARFTPKKYRKD